MYKLLPHSKEAYTLFIDLIRKKISTNFFPLWIYETNDLADELILLGVDNFKCFRTHSSIIIYYNNSTIPYTLMLLYIIAWSPEICVKTLIIKDKAEINHENLSNEEFIDSLYHILKNETILVLEVDEYVSDYIFELILYIKTPYKHDFYYLEESCKLRNIDL